MRAATSGAQHGSMTSFYALDTMASDHRAQMVSQAQDRRLAGRRPAGRRTRIRFFRHRTLSPPGPHLWTGMLTVMRGTPADPQWECGQ